MIFMLLCAVIFRPRSPRILQKTSRDLSPDLAFMFLKTASPSFLYKPMLSFGYSDESFLRIYIYIYLSK